MSFVELDFAAENHMNLEPMVATALLEETVLTSVLPDQVPTKKVSE